MNGFHPVEALVIPSVVFHHKLRDFFVQIKSDFSRIKVHIFPCEGTPELFNVGIISSTTLAVHGYLDSEFLQGTHPLLAGLLRPLVRNEVFEFSMPAYSFPNQCRLCFLVQGI